MQIPPESPCIKRTLLLVSDAGLFIPCGLCNENQKSEDEEYILSCRQIRRKHTLRSGNTLLHTKV